MIDTPTRYRSDLRPPKPRKPPGLQRSNFTARTSRTATAAAPEEMLMTPADARHNYRAAVAFLCDSIGTETPHAAGADWGSIVALAS